MSISTFLEHKQLKFDEKGNHSFSFALSLLQDNNPDTVLQAIQVLNHLKDPRVLEMLRSLLYHPDPNGVQAAIITIGHLGDDRSVSDIAPFLKSDSWLKMAAIKALGELRSSLAVRPLANLLSDPVTGSLAAEALARIGGTIALRVLSKNWLKFHSQLDTEIMLGLLAHVIEGVAKKPPKIQVLLSQCPCLDAHRSIRLSMQCVRKWFSTDNQALFNRRWPVFNKFFCESPY
jgi:HEAT repeat protein